MPYRGGAPLWFRIAAILRSDPQRFYRPGALIEILMFDDEPDYARTIVGIAILTARRHGVNIETRRGWGYRWGGISV